MDPLDRRRYCFISSRDPRDAYGIPVTIGPSLLNLTSFGRDLFHPKIEKGADDDCGYQQKPPILSEVLASVVFMTSQATRSNH